MALLAALPLPVRLIFFALVGILAFKLLSGLGWVFALVAIVLWSITALTLLQASGYAAGMARIPGLGPFLAWVSGRPLTSFDRLGKPTREEPASPPPGGSERQHMLEAAADALEQLRGIDEAREAIASVMDMAEVAQRQGRPGLGGIAPAAVLAIAGGPGTGKTTVARLLGPLLYGHQALEHPLVRPLTVQDMGGGFGGQAGQAAQQAAEASLGGILLLDDADWLLEDNALGGSRPGLEAGRSILRVAEAHSGRLLVVMTLSEEGYRRLTNDPQHHATWLSKLFVEHIPFPSSLAEDDLLDLLQQQLQLHRRAVEPDAISVLRGQIKALQRELGPRFDNAVAMRRLAERLARQTAGRVLESGGPSGESVSITAADVRALTA